MMCNYPTPSCVTYYLLPTTHWHLPGTMEWIWLKQAGTYPPPHALQLPSWLEWPWGKNYLLRGIGYADPKDP